MSDITKCKGFNCPKKETCWRYRAPGNEYYQSYFTEVPYDHKSHGCDHYWQMHEVKNVGS